MQTGVLAVRRNHVLLSFHLHADFQPDGAGYGGLVGPLVCDVRTKHIRQKVDEKTRCKKTFQTLYIKHLGRRKKTNLDIKQWAQVTKSTLKQSI